MAERNFNDPKQREEYAHQLENARNLQAGERGRRPGRGGAGWWWLIFIIVIIICIWIFASGSGNRRTARNGVANTGASTNSGTTMNGNRGANANTGTTAQNGQPANASIPQLISNPKEFEGRPVVVPQATVQKRMNQNAILVGPAGTQNQSQGSESVTVSLPTNTNANAIKQGSQVEITGTVKQAGQGQANLGLSSSQSQKVEQQGFYLQASAVTPLGEKGQNAERRP